MLCLTASRDALKSGVEHRVELGQDADNRTGRRLTPFPIFQSGDGKAEFEFESVVGMKVPAAVAPHDLELSVDRFNEVGRGEGLTHGFGVFQEGKIVLSFLA